MRENLTKVDFKTKQINISVPELPASDALVNHRNLTLKDLLTRLNHYNDGIRKDALAGLKELFEMHPDLLDEPSTLMHVFQVIGLVISDNTRVVRHALLALLQMIIPRVPATRLVPFAPILLAHTSRALTSMDPSVRHDALAFVDIWISHFPDQLVKYSENLMVNLLHLISAERSSKPGAARSLIVNPQSRLVQQQARIDVMRRFLSILRMLVNQVDGAPTSSQTSTQFSWEQPAPLIVYPSHRPTSADFFAGDQHSTKEFIELICDGLVPVLFEVWSELSAGILSDESVDPDALEHLRVLVVRRRNRTVKFNNQSIL